MRKVVPNKDYLRILLTGRSGSTKTRTAYTSALDPEHFGRVLGIDAGGQPRSIADYSPAPDLIAVDSVKDLTLLYNWLAQGQKPHRKLMEMDIRGPYSTVVIDGFTEIQGLIIAGQLGDPTKGNPDVSKDRAMYNVILGQTMGIARAFYSLPMHVIGTVLESERQEGEGGPVVYRHLLVGQSREQLSSYAEIVARLVHIDRLAGGIKLKLKEDITEETISVAMFKSTTKNEAKDQTGRLGAVMVDPTMKQIYELVTEVSS